MDIIGTLPLAKGGAKYAIVVVDYFTKLAEAEPLATITTKKVINFVVRNIICRFGLPHTIITDNGTQSTVLNSRISVNDSTSIRNSLQ